MRSVAPLSVELGAPRAWRTVIVCACIAAIAGSALAFDSLSPVGLLSAVCLGVAITAWRATGRWCGVRLIFDAGGGLELRHRDGSNRKAELDHAIHFGPLLVIIARLRDGGREDIVVWRDQIDSDAWRRLKVRLNRRHDRR